MASNAQQQAKVRKLRDQAATLVTKGKHGDAAKVYVQLEGLDPSEPEWSKRAAECFRRLSQRPQELGALVRAAHGYADQGFLLKAVAMCKMVLAIDPDHGDIQARLGELQGSQRQGLDRVARSRGRSLAPAGASVRPAPAPSGASSRAVFKGLPLRMPDSLPSATPSTANPSTARPASPSGSSTAPSTAPPKLRIPPEAESERGVPPAPQAEPEPEAELIEEVSLLPEEAPGAPPVPVPRPPPRRGPPPPPARPMPPRMPAPPQRAPSMRAGGSGPSIAPGAPLDSVEVASLLPSSGGPRRTSSGAFELALDDLEIIDEVEALPEEPADDPGTLAVIADAVATDPVPPAVAEHVAALAGGIAEPAATAESDAPEGDAPEGDAPEGDAPEGDAPEGDEDEDEDDIVFDDADIEGADDDALAAALAAAEAAADGEPAASVPSLDEAPPPPSLMSYDARATLEASAPDPFTSHLPGRGAAPARPDPSLHLDADVLLDVADEGAAVSDDPLEATFSTEEAPTNPAATARAEGLLPLTPLFSEVDPDMLERLILEVDLQLVEAGETVVEEGAPSRCLYVVADGEVEVVASGQDTALSTLGEGEFFGEIGLITDMDNWRTVRATMPTQLLVFRREAIGRLVDSEPDFLRVLLRFIRARLVQAFTRESPMFAPFSEEERQGLAELFKFLEFEPGLLLMEAGKKPDGLFILLSGGADVLVEGDVVHRLRGGEVFGEKALIEGGVAGVTVRSTHRSFALLLDSNTFTKTVMTHPHVLMYVSELAAQGTAAADAPSAASTGEGAFDPSDLLDFSDVHLDLP